MVKRLFEQLLHRLLVAMESRNRRHSLHGDSAFFNPDLFPWTQRLAARTPEIRAELDELLHELHRLPSFQDISPDQAALTSDAGWRTFFFTGYGVESRRNRQRCPKTAAALRLIPGMTTAYFSILAPGKRIPPHRGPYNGVLRYHLGLRVPVSDERCAIQVDGITRHWAEGESLIFDDTYQHEVWNCTPHWRVVLFVDFLRPLPWLRHVMNLAMMRVIRLTPYVRVAVRNQKKWESRFYG